MKKTMGRSPDEAVKKQKENLTFSRSFKEDSYEDYASEHDVMYCAVDSTKCDGTCRAKNSTASGVVSCSERITKRAAGVGKRGRGKQKREDSRRDR